MRQIRTLFLFLSLFGTVTNAGAEKIPMGLKEIIQRSDVIVSVRVNAVSKVGGIKVAEATVLRSIAGEKVGSKLTFLAQGTWACDDSRAVVGETVLLFLQRHDRSERDTWLKPFWDQHPRFDAVFAYRYGQAPLFQMVNAGDGRLPIGTVRGTSCVIDNRFLPAGLPTFPYAGSKQNGIHAVRLADIIAHIQKLRGSPPIEPANNLSKR